MIRVVAGLKQVPSSSFFHALGLGIMTPIDKFVLSIWNVLKPQADTFQSQISRRWYNDPDCWYRSWSRINMHQLFIYCIPKFFLLSQESVVKRLGQLKLDTKHQEVGLDMGSKAMLAIPSFVPTCLGSVAAGGGFKRLNIWVENGWNTKSWDTIYRIYTHIRFENMTYIILDILHINMF